MSDDSKPEKPLFDGAPGPLQRLIADQRVLFVLVGAANTVFSTALFAALSWSLGQDVPSAVSLFIAWVVSLVLVFNVYRHLVFRVKGHVLRDFLRFVGVNAVSFLINAGALTLLVDVAGLPAIPTQIAITFIVVVVNYLGHKYFSFRRAS